MKLEYRSYPSYTAQVQINLKEIFDKSTNIFSRGCIEKNKLLLEKLQLLIYLREYVIKRIPQKTMIECGIILLVKNGSFIS